MQRYVVANRTAGKPGKQARIASAASLSAALSQISTAQVIEERDDEETGRIVLFEAEASEVERKAAALPQDAIIEPEILHSPLGELPCHADPVEYTSPRVRAVASLTTAGRAFALCVEGGGRPLSGATATLYARGLGGAQRRSVAISDASGALTLHLDDGFTASAVVVVPASGFWPMISRAPAPGDVVSCPPLPRSGPGGWWHMRMGVSKPDLGCGEGIRVGVADTGCGPHPDLEHVNVVGAFEEAAHLPRPNDGLDAGAHGSHVTGIIGGRPLQDKDYMGFAPGCDLFHVRVFRPGRLANQADIALAVELLSRDHRCDLVNLSLGASTVSEILRDRIADAADRGTLCICAAGNDYGPVLYPAALGDTVAVGALGAADSRVPAGSLSASRLPLNGAEFGNDNLYLANFSNRGPTLDCVAPGVGVIASVPGRHDDTTPAYAAMDGSSMAAPAVCGLLATVLSNDHAYRSLPRDRSRSNHARAVLNLRCRDVGLDPELQGRGMPIA